MPQLFPIDGVAQLVKTGGSARVDVAMSAGFKPGDTVTVANINPSTHTRLPRYVRGRTGIVEKDYGVFVFSDTNAELMGQKPQHVYRVVFSARDLWGEGASFKDKVIMHLFEDYIVHKSED